MKKKFFHFVLHIFKAFTYALVLTSQNSRKIHSHSQKQSNSRCLMGVFYHIPIFCVYTKYNVVLHIAWGFCVARSVTMRAMREALRGVELSN